MSSHNLPNLKRLWYCDHLHQKTGGCVCRTHPDQSPKCETICNTSIQQIDQIRAEERRTRLPRRYFPLGSEREKALQEMVARFTEHYITGVMKKIAIPAEPSEETVTRYPRGEAYIAFDELQRWPKLAGPPPTEGEPWHKFIEPNRRKKPT